MFIAILTLLSALSISAVAIYYSIAGLAAIFAGAVIPIMIMGSVLEVGKLITASWLYQYWKVAPRFLKYYLSVAVVVLMFITSMGIFGYLSKAHIEQTSLSQEQVALIDTLDDKLNRSEIKINRWTSEMDRLLKGEDVRVDNLIANEQVVLDSLYAKIKQEKDDIRIDFDKQIELQNNRLTQAKERKDADIAAAQERYKGAFSKKGLDDAIAEAKANELAVASSAQKEILKINNSLDSALSQIDEKYAVQVAEIQNRIQDLRDQANAKTEDIDGRIIEIEAFIDAEQLVVDEVREEKFLYEKEYRKLEAEVGPIKYIAEFIYGQEADRDLLEEAVRWVIIVIIFVFDPLAVLLLIASQYTFDFHRRSKDDSGDRLRQWQDYEQARAQRIVDNPGYNTDDPAALEEEKVDVTEPTTTTDDDLGDMVSENDTTNPDEADTGMEQPEIQTNEDSNKQIADSYLSVQEALETPVEEAVDKSIDIEKKDLESSEELERLSEEEFDALDDNLDWKRAKHQWKQENPSETLKEYKDLYLNGVIDELPWEEHLPEGVDLKKKKRYIMKEKGQQVRKETDE